MSLVADFRTQLTTTPISSLYIRQYQATIRRGPDSAIVSLESGWVEVSNFAARFRARHQGCTVVLRRADKLWRRNPRVSDPEALQEYSTVSEVVLTPQLETQVELLVDQIHVHLHLRNGEQ